MAESMSSTRDAVISSASAAAGDTLEKLRRWSWLPILQGLASVLFGVACFTMTNSALAALVAVFGIYAFVAGLLALYGAFTLASQHQKWFGLLVEGILSIAAGILAYRSPGLTAQALLYVVAAWAILRGILQISTAYALRQLLPGEWATAVSGVLSIALGFLLIAYPQQGLLAWVWVIGLYAVGYGVLLVILGVRLRNLGSEMQQSVQSAAAKLGQG
jgi:uncharacterized membrane protein HdeD (DUF308 family)